ncbi:ArfGap-domain-containing protein [Ascodesmis nigricans]|uniref:ArfGap-domain-containing protein n=1 Tax=Ascodesmis nigricans TaxID=341454 RepID=A0A4S2MNZ5_9PEZI|nr:ArfGap-domain-containing protein [Ascodesmis nigricans]
MSSSSKRHQARNERALQDLIKGVPGNDRCADCGTRNPAWASWNLGIFLCIRCASLHRKLGTHVSKVKSISMDAWTNEQVDTMKKNGNTKSNAFYNPDSAKHPPPLSSEDSDSQLERYIRQKYEYKTFRKEAEQAASSSGASFGASKLSGSTSTSVSAGLSVPKGSKSSGKRSISSMFRGSSSKDKASQILGGTPYTDSNRTKAPVQFPHGMVILSPQEKFSDQLASLHDMGFTNDAQNIKVLEQTNGIMLDTVDILVRLNRTQEQRPEPPPKNDPPAVKQPLGLGLTVQKTGPAAIGRNITGGSNNPFDALDKEEPPLPPIPVAPALQAVQTGGSAPMVLSQTPQNLAMMGYQNTGQSLPVFHHQQQQMQTLQPFATGASLPVQFHQQQQIQQIHQQHTSQWPPQQLLSMNGTGYPQQQQQQPLQPQQTAFNLTPLQSSNPYSPTLTSPASSSTFSANPYQQQLSPQHQQQQFSSPPQPQSPFYPPQQQTQNPYSPSYPPQQQQRIDKSQILALYGTPQLAPQQPQQINHTPIPISSPPAPTQSSAQRQQQQQKPAVGSNNPFLMMGGGRGMAVRESVDWGYNGAVNGGGGQGERSGGQGGRCSPDAFASLAFGGR